MMQAPGELSDGLAAYRSISTAIPRRLAVAGPTSREEMEAFIDGFMAAQLVSGTVAGATVSVVKDGELFFAKGYGLRMSRSKFRWMPPAPCSVPGRSQSS